MQTPNDHTIKMNTSLTCPTFFSPRMFQSQSFSSLIKRLFKGRHFGCIKKILLVFLLHRYTPFQAIFMEMIVPQLLHCSNLYRFVDASCCELAYSVLVLNHIIITSKIFNTPCLTSTIQCMPHFNYFFLNLMVNRKYTTWAMTFYIYELPSTIL